MNSRSFTLVGDATERSTGSFAGILVSAGLLNALVAAFLLCRLPQGSAPSLAKLLARAAIYVCAIGAAGFAGSWFYWKRSSNSSKLSLPLSISAFGLTCAPGWVWVPAIVLLASEGSPVTAAIVAVGGYMLAAGLREAIPLESGLAREVWAESARDPELFAESLKTPARRFQGCAIALGIYAGVFAMHDGSMPIASALLGASAFLFAWESVSESAARSRRARNRRVAIRLGRTALLAVLVTFWALLDGVAHRDRSAADVAFAHGNEGDSSRKVANVANPAVGNGGYESIILWPYPQKKEILPPLPAQANLLAPGTSQPLIISFDGAYWYFQPPETGPGQTAHRARGTPLSAHIQSNNAFPLIMEAHQTLSTAIRLARCREITVEVENRDDQPGDIALAVLLTNSTERGNPAVYLGQQVLQTTLPDRIRVKRSSSFETLRFAIPMQDKIRKFDEITVMLLLEMGHTEIGPKIAIQQFQLFPR